MTVPAWHEEPINKTQKRDSFDCGDDALNTYLRNFARQNHERGGAKTFLALSDADARVLGYYSLAPAQVEYEQTPESLRKGLSRYPIPGFRLARLATDKSVQGSGLGTQLLLVAGHRCLQVADLTGGAALFIDAKHERAAAWYEARGAERMVVEAVGNPLALFISLKTIEAALRAAGKL